MKKVLFCYLVTILAAMYLNCSQAGFQLKIDVSKASSLRYLLGVDIDGKRRLCDTTINFSSSLRTFLQGQDSAGSNQIYLAVNDIRIQSDILDDAQRRNLEQQFEKMKFSYAPGDGEVAAIEHAGIPFIDIQGWDLYRNFTKVFPLFPMAAVKQGDTWEREFAFPVESALGDATGHIYQNYILDSVRVSDSQHQLAYISWRYLYQVEAAPGSDSSYLSKMPNSGDGTARAVLNLSSGTVESAHADFEVHSDSAMQNAIEWHQTIHLELVK